MTNDIVLFEPAALNADGHSHHFIGGREVATWLVRRVTTKVGPFLEVADRTTVGAIATDGTFYRRTAAGDFYSVDDLKEATK